MNEADAAQVFRSALAIIGRNPDRGPIGIGYDLQRIYRGELAGVSLQTYRAIARRATEATEQAQRMESDPSLIIDRGDLPRIPGQTLHPEAFSYRVVLTVRDRDGNSVETVVDYRSNTRVSKADIENDLLTRLAPELGSRPSTREEIARLGPGQFGIIEVIAVGKR